MTWRFFKLKLLHYMNSCFTNLNSTKNSRAPWQRSTSTWGFFKLNDFNVVVNVGKSQIMRCILCHNVQEEELDQSSTQSWKGLVMYNNDHGTTAMSCHVAYGHSIVLRLYQMLHFGVATQYHVPRLLRSGRSHLKLLFLIFSVIKPHTKKQTLLKNNSLRILYFT
jgi:hypothetical protein